MYALYYFIILGGYFIEIAFVVSVARFCYRKYKKKKKMTMVMPKPRDNLPLLMRRLVDSEYRMGSSVMTKRTDLLLAINEMEKGRNEVYQKYKSLILPILLHPRHDHVRFSPVKDEERFLINTNPDPSKGISQVTCGLLRLQKRCFYPDYEYSDLLKVHRIRQQKKEETTGKKREKKKPKIVIPYEDRISTRGTAWNLIDVAIRRERGVGKTLGKQVHEELQEFSRNYMKFLSREHPPDPLTQAVVKKIVKIWKMVPIWGELEIWDENLGYATAVDMICIDPENGGRLVFFEVKTGYKEAFALEHKKVRGPERIWDSPCGHAMIQLILPIETMRRQYGIRNIYGYVIHVNEMIGVKSFKLPIDGKDVSYRRLYNYAFDEEQNRKRSLKRRGGKCERGGKKRRGRKKMC